MLSCVRVFSSAYSINILEDDLFNVIMKKGRCQNENSEDPVYRKSWRFLAFERRHVIADMQQQCNSETRWFSAVFTLLVIKKYYRKYLMHNGND